MLSNRMDCAPLLIEDVSSKESYDLTYNNHLHLGRWRTLQERRDFAPIVNDIRLFWLHYCLAAGPLLFPQCYEGGVLKERFFTSMEREEASDLVDCVDKIREMLKYRLARNENGAFQVRSPSSGNEVVLALDDKKLSGLKGWEAGFLKRNFNELVAPALPKMAELLGAKFNFEVRIKPFLFFGRGSVMKYTFEWNKTTLLRPFLQVKKLALEPLGSELRKLQQKGILCEVSLKAGGKETAIHQLILYQKRCTHLLTLNEVLLDAPGEVLEDFVDFLYLDLNDFVDKMRFHDKEAHLPMLVELASRHKIDLLMRCCIILLNLFASVEKADKWKEMYAKYNISEINTIIRLLKKDVLVW